MGATGLSPAIYYPSPAETLASLGWIRDWDAAYINPATQVVDGKVAAITDAINEVTLSQSDASRRFNYVNSGLDGQPHFSRNTSGDNLQEAAGSLSQPASALAVFTVNALGNLNSSDTIHAYQNQGIFLFLHNQNFGIYSGSTVPITTGNLQRVGASYIIATVFNNANSRVIVNGQIFNVSVGTANGGTNGFGVGNRFSLARTADVNHMKVLLSNKVMSNTEFNQTAAIIRSTRPSLPWTNI